MLSEEELRTASHNIDSDAWYTFFPPTLDDRQLLINTRRKWSNPEVLIFKYGLQLESLESHKIEAILKLVEASLSEAGYHKVRAAMETNHFLGELCNAAPIMNRYSYQSVCT